MHACLYIGTFESVVDSLPLEARQPAGDVIHARGHTLTIDTARSLVKTAATYPLHGAKRHIVIAYERLLREAQNALLKELEEPRAYTIWHIVVPSVDALLPTIRSRLTHISETVHEQGGGEDIIEFIGLPISEKLEIVAKRFKGVKPEEKESAKLWAGAVLRALEKDAVCTNNATQMRALIDVRSVWELTGASPKMLLEYVLLVTTK